MAVYFSGRKQVGSFSVHPHKRAVLSCQIFERWEDIECGSTARCGAPGSIEVKKEVGLSQRSYETINSSIAGSIGIEGLASLKSKITETIGREANWSVAETTTKTFAFQSPKCGRRTETIYQLVREYELSYRREKRFSTEAWERLIRELVQCHDAVPEIDPFDEACNCPPPPRRSYDGRLLVDMGEISMRVSFRRTAEGILINFGRETCRFEDRGDEEFHGTVPTSSLPESLLFLGNIQVDRIEAMFALYEEPLLVGPFSNPADELLRKLKAFPHTFPGPANLENELFGDAHAG